MNYASLCVLSYNRPEWFFNSIHSLLHNSDEKYELIIHDDGSTDSVLKTYIRNLEDQNIGPTIITNKSGWNQGQGVALNRMFHMASGDYIFKLDADLEYEPNWLSKAVTLMERNEEIGLLGLLHYYHDPVDSKQTIVADRGEWSEHTHILGSGFCVRRETWEELGPFEEHSDAFAEDWTFQQKVHKFSKWKVALPKIDLVKNNAMGIGNSTIVKQGTDAPTITRIHKTPYLLSNQG